MAKRAKMNIRGKLGVGDHHHRITAPASGMSMLAGVGIALMFLILLAAFLNG